MKYMIDQAEILMGNTVQTFTLLIENNRIDYMSKNLNKLQYLRMDVSSFVLTPGHVMLDLSFPLDLNFSKFKEYFQKKFLQHGCTTVLIGCHVEYEREILEKINALRVRLLNCPIDYYLCVKIPQRALTSSFVRQCKKRKIPALFVEIDNEEKLEKIEWGWIREALFGYFLPLVPIWKIGQESKKTKLKLEEKWREIMRFNQVPAIPYSLTEHFPLDKNVLKKIGISPHKGEIRIGGEVDYNLYYKADLGINVAENVNVDYHIHSPKITVHKNQLLKVNQTIYFRPGFGNECIVKTPGFFKAYFDNEI